MTTSAIGTRIVQLRRLARGILRSPEESSLTWPGGVRLTRLRPVKPRDVHVTNKFGRITLRGEHEGRPIKLIEAFSIEHAQFLAAMSALPALRARFPEVIASHGRFLVTRWVEGTAPPRVIDDLVELQLALHRTELAGLPPAGYDLWRDFLRPRLVRAAEMAGRDPDGITASVDDVADRHPRTLVQPDLRLENLVAVNGMLVSIDNEACTTSALPLLDVCHTAHALRGDGQRYWTAYLRHGGARPDPNELRAVRGAWLARLAGAAFVAGRIGESARLLDEHHRGRNLLPFDPT
ncbi:MAG: hypothetical protein KIT31_00595 [Deltaproteobacteria bacterium]|nr:hypothetical protein [Deltaproteobacteria bacterium]